MYKQTCKGCQTEFTNKSWIDICPICRGTNIVRKEVSKATIARKAREQVYKDCGLVKVRGALSGTYWE